VTVREASIASLRAFVVFVFFEGQVKDGQINNKLSNLEHLTSQLAAKVRRLEALVTAPRENESAPNNASSVLGTAEDRKSADAKAEQQYSQQEKLIASQEKLVTWTRNAFIAAAVYAGLAAWQGWAAMNAVSTAREQMRLDQRAWLVFKKIGPGPPELGKPWQVSIYFDNSGKTPARNASWYCVDELAKDESSVKWYRLSPKDFPTMVAPNDEKYCTIPVSNGEPVPQKDLDVLTKGELSVFFYGAGTYEDVFGQFHWFTFCQFMDRTKDIRICQTNNDTGDGKTPPPPLGLPPNMKGGFTIPVPYPTNP
jgi:hypothetical protein